MVTYFRQLLDIILRLLKLFCEIVYFKMSLILRRQRTETILFQGFLQNEITRIFIENYFPKLYQKFLALHDFSLECNRNGF